MNNKLNMALDEQFKADCKVIDLKFEYAGYTGNVRWAIITELTEREILEKYPEQAALYLPFMILSPEFGEIRSEYRRNEKKHQARAKRSVDAFSYDDDVIAAFHPELIGRTLEDFISYVGRVEDEDTVRKIKDGLRYQFSLAQKPRPKRTGLILSLCPTCRGEFFNIPDNILRRVDPLQAEKEVCDKCQVRYGYDYLITKRVSRSETNGGNYR